MQQTSYNLTYYIMHNSRNAHNWQIFESKNRK